MFSCVVFVFFRKQKSTVSGWQPKVCGSLFPAKHSASIVKAAVVTQLNYSCYPKSKPLGFLFIFPLYLVVFKGGLQRQSTSSQNPSMCRLLFFSDRLFITVVPPFPSFCCQSRGLFLLLADCH